jgi:hypothetical protein
MPFSGSTMLGLMLGRHPKAAFLGETDLLARKRPDGTWRHRKYCSMCQDQDGERCPIWSRERVAKIREDLGRVHRSMAECHPNADFLVDSSKDWEWWSVRLVDPGISATAVHVTKSVEAYVASVFTRHPMGRPVEFVAEDWATGNRVVREHAIAHSIPYLHLRYAGVASDPQTTFRRLGALLAFTPEERQEEFWNQEAHYIRGNPGTASHIDGSRAKKEPGVNQVLYETKHRTIFVDDKWKKVLTPAQIDRIYALPSVRRESEILGYTHPLSNGLSMAHRLAGSLVEPGIRLTRRVGKPIRDRFR